MSQLLTQEFDALAKHGALNTDIPEDITKNISSHITMRPYQLMVLKRWLFYIEKYDACPHAHLLFHMATGSGKTVLMAALILDLYRRGYRNFLFFVNSSQIIQKTKENFLNSASSKHLFAPNVRINNKPVAICAVNTFDGVSSDAINIHFTTIQGLHSRMQAPKENEVTIEDFRNYKVVMISDEAHHLNAETKKMLTSGEKVEKASWEGTVSEIFQQHPENVLLEFTATVDLGHEAIREKYADKVLYDYSLRQFREDGYSKEIDLRQADLPSEARMMQAIILSQYRRKVAEAHGIQCKPVILMKSKTINDSAHNEAAFTSMVANLNSSVIDALRVESDGDETLEKAFAYIMHERSMSAEDFARELQSDFAPEKVLNVNNPKDLENSQIELNALEDRDNELRVIFAVDKLNEGWDVLNLFDIVRLYDTRDGKSNKVGKTTMAEAQLIGRGARYFPFIAPDQPDAAREKRKYDSMLDNPLRILEVLHYHCSHNPKYIQDIRNALRETGMLDDTARSVHVKLKDSFKQNSLYLDEFVWMNERVKNSHDSVSGLDAYNLESLFTYPNLMTGRVTEFSAFEIGHTNAKPSGKEPVSRDFKLADLGSAILGFAMDASDFFHFTNLRKYFPNLASASQFITSSTYLGGVTVSVRGLPDDLDNLRPRQRLDIAQYVLSQIESGVKRESVEYIGTKDFKPYPIKDLFTDKVLKLRIEGETGLSWAESKVPGLDQINLSAKEWYAYDDSYGTDQEKHFIKYMHDHEAQLKSLYDEFFLLRNEKAVKLYDFDSGRAFEPDFVLFLKNKGDGVHKILQLFIEPKGEHLQIQDNWKQEFLIQLRQNARLETIFQGRDYAVYGLPFFNERGDVKSKFKDAFDEVISNR